MFWHVTVAYQTFDSCWKIAIGPVVKKVTGCRAYSDPTCSWQIDYIGLWPPLRVIDDASLIAVDTLSSYIIALLVQLANSSHNTMALETNLCHLFRFLGHLHQKIQCILSQKPINNGPVVKKCHRYSTFPTFHRHLILPGVETAFSKSSSKISDSISLFL